MNKNLNPKKKVELHIKSIIDKYKIEGKLYSLEDVAKYQIRIEEEISWCSGIFRILVGAEYDDILKRVCKENQINLFINR
jgi:hypothetical protein